MRRIVLAGEDHPEYEPLDDMIRMVGKTVTGLVLTAVEGAYGNEPCYEIMFSDGTKQAVVTTKEGDDEDWEDFGEE